MPPFQLRKQLFLLSLSLYNNLFCQHMLPLLSSNPFPLTRQPACQDQILFCWLQGNLWDKCHPFHYALLALIHIYKHMHTQTRSTLSLCESVLCLHPSQMYSGCHRGAMVTNHKPKLMSCLYYWHVSLSGSHRYSYSLEDIAVQFAISETLCTVHTVATILYCLTLLLQDCCMQWEPTMTCFFS